MHESGLIKNLLKTVEEKVKPDKVDKITFAVSKIGGISQDHLKHHFDEYIQQEDNRWKHARVEIKEVEYGKDVDLISVTYKKV